MIKESNVFFQRTLKVAAIYNLVWGAFIVLFPHAIFDFAGLPRMVNYIGIWQCVGMIVGVYVFYSLTCTFDKKRYSHDRQDDHGGRNYRFDE